MAEDPNTRDAEDINEQDVVGRADEPHEEFEDVDESHDADELDEDVDED